MTATAPTRPDHELRPWGDWEVLDEGRGFKVKRLTVRPHSRLSLQTHVYRSEHWLVVSGVASCTIGHEQSTVGAGEHAFVPRGVVHRIANDQADDLVIVEVQLGVYTGEDDIVRLADDHGRT